MADNQAALDFEKRVGQYVQLRDKISEITEAQKLQLKPYKEALEKLGGMLQTHLQSIGGESVKTATGTVYQSKKDSATVSDPDAFMKYVEENHAFELLDRRANVTAVRDFIAEHQGQTPPGVSFSTILTIGVRRA